MLYKKITNWLLDYLKQSNLETFIIGVSGGIDSAVTSTLAARTGCPTILVSMPIHQNHEQLRLAHSHMKWLQSNHENVTLLEFNLTDIYESFKLMFIKDVNDLALANSRARLRMTTLYQIAQTNKGLVVGTGNKVEDFGVGFFTKYGDGGVDLSPIADLMKSEVRKMGEELGVNSEIISAAPTDGLWADGRSDEDQLGASYDELEWAMNYTGKVDDLLGRQKEIYYIYKKLHNINQHKMQPIPVYKV